LSGFEKARKNQIFMEVNLNKNAKNLAQKSAVFIKNKFKLEAFYKIVHEYK
jgi:hypothetical protein